jgi:hypothetical protein
MNPSSYYLKPGRRHASRKLGLGPNPRPTARFPLLIQRSSHALQVLDERPGGAATTRCAAGVRLRRSTPRFLTLATTHGSAPALGCACRPGPCSRASARGGRRVGPVAGHDAAAAGVSRRVGTPTCSHDLLKSRVEARITSRPACPAQTLGQQQSGATANTGTHRRDARSAPGLDGAVRRGNALPTSHLHKRHGTKASSHILLPSRTRRGSRTSLPASHGDGSAQEHRRLRGSLRRGAAHLRHHDHLPGTIPRRRASTPRQHRQSQGGEKRKVWWCSRGVDGVVVAGLLESWRRCSGDADVPPVA